jgi:DNA end-binding protein Ku
MMGLTLRYPYEVRKEEDYFDEITDQKITKDMLDLASHIVEQKRAKSQPEKFEDRYEDALKELLAKKQKGVKIERAKERAPSNVVNLMEALRASVQSERRTQSPRKAASRTTRTAQKRGRSTARHKKAG